MPVAACKLLTYKGQYSTCHIKVPDIDTKLAAIRIDGQYYSLFRQFDDAETAVSALNKLAQNTGDELALTQKAHDRYVIWVLEVDAQAFKGPRQKGLGWPTYGPSKCLMLGEAKQYHQCYVQVPDLMEPVVAVHYEDRFYSVYQPGLDAAAALELAAQFTWRGNESAIAATPKGYAVCLWEPEAAMQQPAPV
ncbi:hypothetical protein IQ260_12805 [Leptolyngbya cf. ectocarpi LEGE 11479]|uniref:Uncharacterized protein n=1 Tax=Leptolyngbya cf. ectocarpi LEGE 11479 TaxID=1828722 RepID=A0A929F9F5_LEPEC|nr:hypothetical protein [Leptolyngbya ectocarpi]MBE9067539.1 hypothetical protein [Leptolyngbya cf. ectocarpi LEGE 11479]